MTVKTQSAAGVCYICLSGSGESTDTVESLVQCTSCSQFIHRSCDGGHMHGKVCMECVSKRVLGGGFKPPRRVNKTEAQPPSESEGEGETIGSQDSDISSEESVTSLDGFIKHDSETSSEDGSEEYIPRLFIHVRGTDVFFGNHAQLKHCDEKKGPHRLKDIFPRSVRDTMPKKCVFECDVVTTKRQRDE
jgi:hypothetical protein